MAIKMIMAVDKHWGIGYKNRLPWNIKEDLAFFKKITEGSVVVMGRKTFESMGSEPLPNRMNYVLTNKDMPEHDTENLQFINDKSLKFTLLFSYYVHSVFIIGGKSLYEQFAPSASEIIVTNINGDYETDVKIDPKIFRGFKIDKKEYLSDRANVIYYKRK